MLKLIARLKENRTLYQYRGRASNMYLLADIPGNASYLVDCGMPSDAAGLIEVLGAFPPLRRIVCTHFHVDHISAWPELKKKFKHCSIWFHKKAEPYVSGAAAVPMPGIGDILGTLLPVMNEYRYLPSMDELRRGALFGTPFKKGFPQERVEFFRSEQEVLPGFLTIETAGHRPDEVSYLETDSGCLISGDFIIVLHNRIKVNTFLADKEEQLTSLERLRHYPGLKTICPGHGQCRAFSLNDI